MGILYCHELVKGITLSFVEVLVSVAILFCVLVASEEVLLASNIAITQDVKRIGRVTHNAQGSVFRPDRAHLN